MLDFSQAIEPIVVVKDLWIKKVWEICRSMKDWPINLQVKNNVVHKIRPAAWYSSQRTGLPPFTCLEDFISAMEQTVWQNPKTREYSGTWLVRFLESYKNYYGVSLKIPRWNDIESKYRQNT